MTIHKDTFTSKAECLDFFINRGVPFYVYKIKLKSSQNALVYLVALDDFRNVWSNQDNSVTPFYGKKDLFGLKWFKDSSAYHLCETSDWLNQ